VGANVFIPDDQLRRKARNVRALGFERQFQGGDLLFLLVRLLVGEAPDLCLEIVNLSIFCCKTLGCARLRGSKLRFEGFEPLGCGGKVVRSCGKLV